MDLVKIIRQAVDKAVSDLSLGKVDYAIDHPIDMEHGDYACNVAMKGFDRVKDKFKLPRELGEAITSKLKGDKNLKKIASEITVAGPGFINISIQTSVLVSLMEELLKEGKGKGELKGKKMMVEYAHPNTHKQFHIGHLRNISLGESICRILEANGAEVIRTNYQGDVGLHIAKAIWGVQSMSNDFKKVKSGSVFEKTKFLGKAYVAGSKAYEEDEKAKEKIVEYNKQIFAGKGEIISLWKETREWSLEYFDLIYKRVGTKYDRLYFESECVDGLERAKEALNKGILKKSKGAVVFDGSKYGLDTRVFINSLGLPTYEAKELSLAPKEFTEFGNLDKCIHVVGPEQQSFFSVTFKVEELLDAKMFKDKQYHKVYAYVNLKSGKMSSRKGKVVSGWEVLEGTKDRIIKENKCDKEKAEKIAVGAVKYAFLKVQPMNEIAFDFDESISLEGNSGPYLQYTYARTQSVLRKASLQGQTLKVENLSKEEMVVLRKMSRFIEVVEEAGKELAPNLIANFLYDLAQKYNGFYNKHSILKAEKKEDKLFRLKLTEVVGKVIKQGLYLLGVETLEKM